MKSKIKTHAIRPSLRMRSVSGSPLAAFLRGDWQEYERMKQQIIKKNLSAKEYEKEIKKICDLLMV